MLAAQRPPRAVHGRRPVRRLLRHIDGGQGFGAGGPQEDAIAGLAAFTVVLHPLTVVVMALTTAFMMRSP